MPIYEYRCKACGNRFECLIRRSSDPAQCSVCGSGDLEQLLSACAVHSESATQANLSAAHQKASASRHQRARDEHRQLHTHFDDGATH
ncbi:MAG: zinc ribbon domain-containing protein [Acidobacteriia bacterium]|nr:zinc ribbon domain-containing protein [Terriglobia bacterium]